VKSTIAMIEGQHGAGRHERRAGLRSNERTAPSIYLDKGGAAALRCGSSKENLKCCRRIP